MIHLRRRVPTSTRRAEPAFCSNENSHRAQGVDGIRGGGNTVSCLGVRASGRRRHREERGRSFERLRNRRSVFEGRRNESPLTNDLPGGRDGLLHGQKS